MDPTAFRHEHARLTRDLTDALLIEERLSREIEQGDALAASGQSLPPGYAETRWLAQRAREQVQKLRNQLDRVTQRRAEAVQAAVLDALRAKWPKDVAKIERDAAASFTLEGGAA